LETLGLVVNEGKIIDASFVEVPRQRNNRDENKKLKNNEIPVNLVNYHKKTQMLSGQRKIIKHFLVIKTM